jgi:hypothetical protein
MGIIAISGARERDGEGGVLMRVGGVEGLGGCSVGRDDEDWSGSGFMGGCSSCFVVSLSFLRS